MNTKPTVLIAGITGTLGNKIATEILAKGTRNVKGLVRSIDGNGKLDELHNDRYPHIHPTTVKQFITQAGL